MKAKKLSLILVALLLSATFVMLVQIQSAEGTLPSVITTSTNNDATGLPFQRKSFYASSRFWVFLHNGTYINYYSSIDGETWSSATTLRASADDTRYSTFFNGTYLHYVVALDGPASETAYYRRGTPNSDGTITWSTAEQTITLTGADYVNDPNIAVDTNGYPWIAYEVYYDGTHVYPAVAKSDTNDGTWNTASGFPYNLSATSGVSYPSIISLTEEKMLTIYFKQGFQVKAQTWDGDSWNSEAQTTSSCPYGYTYSVVADGDDANLIFLNVTTFEIIHTKYDYGTNSFGSESVVYDSDAAIVESLSKDSTSNDLYCFWASKPVAGHVYYKVYNATTETWDTDPTDWIDESSDGITSTSRVNVFYQSYGGYLGVAYMTKTSAPYNIKFNYLTVTAEEEEETTHTYTVTITKDKDVVLVHDMVSFVIHPLRDGVTINDIVCNVTVDGNNLQVNNTDRIFTYTEIYPQAHTFSLSDLYDNELGYSVDFNVTELTVAWQTAGSGNGITPTPTPETTPTLPSDWLPELPEVNENDLAIVAFVGIAAVTVVLSGAAVGTKVRKKQGKKDKKTKVPKTSRR